MRVQYILFDLDGTLTDPQEGITTSVQYALKALGIDVPDKESLIPFIGPPLKDSFHEFYHLDEKETEFAIEKYREWFAPTGIYQNRLYPGIADMLSSLKAAGKTLAVASSKPTVFVEKILHHFEIYHYFDCIVGSELNGVRGKKEEVVEEALRQLKPDRECTVMVGDREFDIFGGKMYHLSTIGVTFGYAKEGELEGAGADHIADSIEELQNLLMQ